MESIIHPIDVMITKIYVSAHQTRDWAFRHKPNANFTSSQSRIMLTLELWGTHAYVVIQKPSVNSSLFSTAWYRYELSSRSHIISATKIKSTEANIRNKLLTTPSYPYSFPCLLPFTQWHTTFPVLWHPFHPNRIPRTKTWPLMSAWRSKRSDFDTQPKTRAECTMEHPA